MGTDKGMKTKEDTNEIEKYIVSLIGTQSWVLVLPREYAKSLGLTRKDKTVKVTLQKGKVIIEKKRK
jgi:hypothetical protein